VKPETLEVPDNVRREIERLERLLNEALEAMDEIARAGSMIGNKVAEETAFRIRQQLSPEDS
jgi:hypothetical protein